MNYATEMQPRKERVVTSKKEGAATYQSTRANRKPAQCRKTHTSITTPRDEVEQMPLAQLALTVLVGFLFMFSFMWLAAAY